MKIKSLLILGTFLSIVTITNMGLSKIQKGNSNSMQNLLTEAKADGEGFFDTWLWVEQMTTTNCTYTVTTSVRIEDPNNPGTFIYSSETSTMNGHWQNCTDGPEFCSSGCRG